MEYWIHCSSLWLQLSCINSDFELGHGSTTVEVHHSVQTTSQCNENNRPWETTVHEIFKSGRYWRNMYISLRSNFLHFLGLRKWSLKLLLFTCSDRVDLIIYSIIYDNGTTVICLFKSLIVETHCLSVPVKDVRCRRTVFTEGGTHYLRNSETCKLPNSISWNLEGNRNFVCNMECKVIWSIVATCSVQQMVPEYMEDQC